MRRQNETSHNRITITKALFLKPSASYSLRSLEQYAGPLADSAPEASQHMMTRKMITVSISQIEK